MEVNVFGMGESVAERLIRDGHQNIVHLQRASANYYVQAKGWSE
ncbi:MAG: hypothetical protein ACK5NG_11465 [Chthoniobacterales bacterium]